ncbi:MAG: HAD family phosphatase [Acidimicrobiales bacterium]|nr:HAD family phosphatase [Acidimicrobiales bacterium]
MTADGLEAVVFDFDGTIFDSETPIYRASAAALAEMGLDLTIEGWATAVGLGEDDSFEALCAAVGTRFDRREFETRYGAQDRSWRDRLPALPGIDDLVRDLHGAEVALGVASSSSSDWVERHLARLGLRDRFTAIGTRDKVGGRSKPDPASYRWAVEALGADPSRTVAIEDSAPGIAAAQAAGLAVVAIPSAITSHTDLSAADRTVGAALEIDRELLASLLA